jgi:tetratricopeptide (TPR) repeat protein
MKLNFLSKNKPLKTLLAMSFIFASLKLEASTLKEFYIHFKNGQYPKAIETLDKIELKDNSLSSKAYLKGICFSKLQEFDQAIKEFEIAIKEKNSSNDLYYEFGQSLYAANELKKAREAFKTSADKGFNAPASLYYVAHISQILEEYDVSRETYAKVIKLKEADLKMKQISHFQLAETLLSIAREKSTTPDDLNRRVDKFILPMMQKAFNLDKSSVVATDINQRLAELMQEFNLDPNMLINGRRITPKRYTLSFSQKMKYDDNISLTNEENNIQQSKKESYIFDTEVFGKYDFIVKKRFVISPEARINFTEHTDQSSPEVFQNDSLVINTNLKNKFEHKFKERPASFIFDIDYSRTSRDWRQTKSRDFYASAITYTLAESVSYFNFGDTTLKIKRKNYDGENTSISNHTTSLSLDQTVFLPTQHLLIGLLDMSFIDNYNNTSTNTDTYLLRFDYLIPEIFPQYTLGIALATTVTDTKAQKASRGTEVSYNPSLDLSKEITQRAKIGINYDFTKSKSKNATYSYSKNVLTTEFRYSF